MVRSTIA